MRIGLFTDTYTPDINGVVTSIVTLKKSLEELGHTVFVITNHASMTQTSFEDHVLRLPGVELKFLYGYTMSSPLHIQAQKIVKEMKLDLVHVHSEFGVGIFGRAIANSLFLPQVSTYHTTYEDYTHYVNILGIKAIDTASKKAVARLSRVFTKGAQVIIAPSEKTRLMLLGYGIKKEIAVIPTGLDLNRFTIVDEEQIKTSKHDLGIEDHTVFVYVGRLAKEKSVDFVIDCFAALYEKSQDIKLVIVGDGPSMDDLKEQVADLKLEDVIHFVGVVASDQVVAYYHMADAFISASLTETQGLTYIEAMASGLPVFARPDEPLEEIVLDRETGFLFNDAQEFVLKAQELMSQDAVAHDKMRAAGLAIVDQFALSKYGNKMINVYQRAIDYYYGKYQVVAINHDGDLYSIELESDKSNEIIELDEFVFGRRELEEGMELSRNEIKEIQGDALVHEAYQLALTRIGARDYTSFEMSEYLKDRTQISSEQVGYVIDMLVRRRFIDDERYFRDRMDYLRSLHRGNNWILEDLLKRGFEQDKILNAFDIEDNEAYEERGIVRAEKFLRTLSGGSRKEREDKLRQHLNRNGFGGWVVSKVIQSDIWGSYDGDDERESLKKVLQKSLANYGRRYDEFETRTRAVRHALNKGYSYDDIVGVLEEIKDNEN